MSSFQDNVPLITFTDLHTRAPLLEQLHTHLGAGTLMNLSDANIEQVIVECTRLWAAREPRIVHTSSIAVFPVTPNELFIGTHSCMKQPQPEDFRAALAGLARRYVEEFQPWAAAGPGRTPLYQLANSLSVRMHSSGAAPRLLVAWQRHAGSVRTLETLHGALAAAETERLEIERILGI